MSLIRLLTTTRSLSDVKNEPSPYRMTEQGLLPKFGPKKQREANPPPHVGGYTAPPADETKENLGEGNGDRTDAGCSLKREESRKPPGSAECGTRNAEFGWLGRWWQKWFQRRPRRECREPVQAELALDLVTVVRNDLRDEAPNTAPERPSKEKPRSAEEKQEAESVFGASRG